MMKTQPQLLKISSVWPDMAGVDDDSVAGSENGAALERVREIGRRAYAQHCASQTTMRPKMPSEHLLFNPLKPTNGSRGAGFCAVMYTVLTIGFLIPYSAGIVDRKHVFDRRVSTEKGRDLGPKAPTRPVERTVFGTFLDGRSVFEWRLDGSGWRQQAHLALDEALREALRAPVADRPATNKNKGVAAAKPRNTGTHMVPKGPVAIEGFEDFMAITPPRRSGQ